MKVLITGATGGIGQALVEVYYRQGWEIIAIGRNRDILKKLEKKYKDKIEVFQSDIAMKEELDILLKKLEEIEIELIINGAGIGELGAYETISFDEEQRMINLNVIALVRITKYFYQRFKRLGKGGIINISSTAGFQYGGPLMAGYYAAKSYVNSLTFGLIGENDNVDIRIMLLCPGPTATSFKGMREEIKGCEKFYITTPAEVAENCYKDYERGRKVSIPGKINKMLYYLNKFIPWEMQLAGIKKIQKKK